MRKTPDPPADGRELMNWIYRQPGSAELHQLALAIGRERGSAYPIAQWTPEEALAVWSELAIRREPGGKPRGAGSAPLARQVARAGHQAAARPSDGQRPAGSGRVMPK